MPVVIDTAPGVSAKPLKDWCERQQAAVLPVTYA